MSHIYETGKGRFGIKHIILVFSFILLLSTAGTAREAAEEWLAGRIFEGGGATLFLAPDGFFALRMADGTKKPRDLTGLWNLAPDGVGLRLSNYQDLEVKLTVGNDAVYGAPGLMDSQGLYPAPRKEAVFNITGILTGDKLEDAGSGRIFPVTPAPGAEDGKFATAEITAGPAGIKPGRILRHSGKVPRFYQKSPDLAGIDAFMDLVAGHYWRMPALAGVAESALRFGIPRTDAEGLSGQFAVSAPGIRFEGEYSVRDDKLTFNAPQSSLRNLQLIGAEALAGTLLGEFKWQLSPRGLELSGERHLVLTGGERQATAPRRRREGYTDFGRNQ